MGGTGGIMLCMLSSLIRFPSVKSIPSRLSRATMPPPTVPSVAFSAGAASMPSPVAFTAHNTHTDPAL